MSELLRLAAFTLDPRGGNPAGVWIGERLPDAVEMQRIAVGVGYSETAFLAPNESGQARAYRVRFFSVAAEVPFCGHATIASGVALAERAGPGRFELTTNDGVVVLEVAPDDDGHLRSTLTSVPPRVRPAEPTLVTAAMGTLGWTPDVLDPALPPAVGYAGVSHLILAVSEYETLRGLSYDYDRLREIMLGADLTTLQLVWRETPGHFRARDPFPVGDVVEDPATGAAAGALGAYLRWRGELTPPARFTIAQGVEMGRPSHIEVEIPGADGGIRVTGAAVHLPGGVP